MNILSRMIHRLRRFLFDPPENYKATGRFEYPGGRVIDVDQTVTARSTEAAFLMVYRPLITPEAPSKFNLYVTADPDFGRGPLKSVSIAGYDE